MPVGQSSCPKPMSFVDHSVVEESCFNKIRTFEDQRKSPDNDLLRGIGYNFVKNGAHNRLAAEIVHLHITLEEGMLLLHERHECKDTTQSETIELELDL